MLINKRINQFISHIHILDYAVILMIIFSACIYFMFFTRKKIEVIIDVFSPSAEWSSADLLPPIHWQSKNITQGTKIYNFIGQPTTEVISISKTPAKAGLQEFSLITLKVFAYYNSKTHQYTFEGKPILVGNDFIIETDKTTINGQVAGIYQDISQKNQQVKVKKATVKVKYRMQEPWIAEKLKTANIIDNNQTVLSTTSTIITAAEDAQPNWQGQLVRTFHPYKKDVVVLYELSNIYCFDFGCFYNGFAPLSIGKDFVVDLGTITPTDNSSIMDVVYHD